MKNIDIAPGTLVPREIRLEVYEEMLNRIETNNPVLDDGVFGLCLCLPVILWDLHSFMQDAPNGKVWGCAHVPQMFLEISEAEIEYICDIHAETISCSEERKERRIEVLKRAIAKIK